MVADSVEFVLGVSLIVDVHLETGVEVQPILLEVGDIGGHRGGVDHVVADIQHRGELHIGFVFLLPDDALRLEPLQVQDQDLRGLVQGDFLGGQLVVFAR